MTLPPPPPPPCRPPPARPARRPRGRTAAARVRPLPPPLPPTASRPRWPAAARHRRSPACSSLGAGRGRHPVARRRPEPPGRVGPARGRPGRLRRGRARASTFDHPVYVDFLTAAEYTDGRPPTTTPASERRARADLDRYAGELRALGVASGEVDLFEALQPGVRRRHARVLRPHRRARAGAGHRDDGRASRSRSSTSSPTPCRTSTSTSSASTTGDSTAARRRPSAAWPRATPSASRRATSARSSPTSEQTAYDEEYAGRARRQRGGHRRRARRSSSATFGAPYALGPAVRHDARSTGTATTSVDRAFDDAARHRGAPVRPGQLPGRGGPADDVELGLRRRRRAVRRGPVRRHQLVPVPRRAHRPEGRLRGRARLERRRASPPSSATAPPACGPPSSATPTDDEAQMEAALDAWIGAMPGGERRARRGRRPPRARGVRPGRGRSTSSSPAARRRPCTSRTSGATSWPTPPPRSTPDGARCYARAVLDELDLRGDHRPRGRGVRRRRVPDRRSTPPSRPALARRRPGRRSSRGRGCR